MTADIRILCDTPKDAERVKRAVIQDVGVLVDWKYDIVYYPRGAEDRPTLLLLGASFKHSHSFYLDYFTTVAKNQDVTVHIYFERLTQYFCGKHAENMRKAWLLKEFYKHIFDGYDKMFSQDINYIKEDVSKYLIPFYDYITSFSAKFYPD